MPFRRMFVTTSIILACFGYSRCNAPVATPADKFALLNNEDLKFLMGFIPGQNGGFLSIENREYKCRILNTLYQNAERNFRGSREQRKLTWRMRTLLQSCPTSDFRMTEFFNQSFIFPGTKWCGQGNAAENYHDLGTFNETDACCRDHDFCDDIIQSGRTKHNLINPYGTTRLHCKCDEELRRCFRNVNSVIANTVGYIFFSLLQTQCFDFNYPTAGCAQWRRGAVRLYCVKYALDKRQPKKWQWFDQEPYF